MPFPGEVSQQMVKSGNKCLSLRRGASAVFEVVNRISFLYLKSQLYLKEERLMSKQQSFRPEQTKS